MSITKYILSLIVLILTILVTKSSNAETTCTENELGDQTCITTSTSIVPGITTDNLVSQEFLDGSWTYNNNSNHGTGTIAGVDGQYFETTVSLNNDANLTKQEINSGFSSTFGADVWFWTGNTNQNVILKQTLVDDNGNIITQQRIINHTQNGYQTYDDTILVNPNNQQDFNITSRIEVNVPGVSGHGGADIKNPTLNVTTNSSIDEVISETFTFCYDRVPNACTYDNQALEDISDLKTDTGQTYNEFVDDRLKFITTDDFKLEDFTLMETAFLVENDYGEVEEFKVEEFTVNSFNSFITEYELTETFETALIEEDLGREDFFEVMTNTVEENFSMNTFTEISVDDFKGELSREEFMDTMTDSIREEFGEDFDMSGNDLEEDFDMSSDDFKEDIITEGGPGDLTENTVEEETVETEIDTTDLKESNDTTTETKVEEESNETNTESETSENVSSKSDVDKNTETEGTETETNNEETVETTAETDVNTDSGTSIDTRSVDKKVERVIAKVLKKLNQVDKKLEAVQFITTQGIKSGEADISGYINRRIYSNNSKLNDPLADDFLQRINILEQQQIYKDASLVAYKNNDPIAVKQRLTVEVEQEINRIQAELYALKQKKEQL